MQFVNYGYWKNFCSKLRGTFSLTIFACRIQWHKYWELINAKSRSKLSPSVNILEKLYQHSQSFLVFYLNTYMTHLGLKTAMLSMDVPLFDSGSKVKYCICFQDEELKCRCAKGVYQIQGHRVWLNWELNPVPLILRGVISKHAIFQLSVCCY